MKCVLPISCDGTKGGGGGGGGRVYPKLSPKYMMTSSPESKMLYLGITLRNHGKTKKNHKLTKF